MDHTHLRDNLLGRQYLHQLAIDRHTTSDAEVKLINGNSNLAYRLKGDWVAVSVLRRCCVRYRPLLQDHTMETLKEEIYSDNELNLVPRCVDFEEHCVPVFTSFRAFTADVKRNRALGLVADQCSIMPTVMLPKAQNAVSSGDFEVKTPPAVRIFDFPFEGIHLERSEFEAPGQSMEGFAADIASKILKGAPMSTESFMPPHLQPPPHATSSSSSTGYRLTPTDLVFMNRLKWPLLSTFEFPSALLERLRNFLDSYPQDIVPINLAVAACIMYFTNEFNLRCLTMQFPCEWWPIKLATFVIYFPHYLKFFELHNYDFYGAWPLSWMNDRHKEDVERCESFRVQPELLDEDEIERLLGQARPLIPGITLSHFVRVFPASQPGSRKKWVEFEHDAPCRPCTGLFSHLLLDDVNHLGLSSYEFSDNTTVCVAIPRALVQDRFRGKELWNLRRTPDQSFWQPGPEGLQSFCGGKIAAGPFWGQVSKIDPAVSSFVHRNPYLRSLQGLVKHVETQDGPAFPIMAMLRQDIADEHIPMLGIVTPKEKLRLLSKTGLTEKQKQRLKDLIATDQRTLLREVELEIALGIRTDMLPTDTADSTSEMDQC